MKKMNNKIKEVNTMKKIGWSLIVIGALSFIGAASKGHSVFGPLMWIGIGGTMVYLKREREECQTEVHNNSKEKTVEGKKCFYENNEVKTAEGIVSLTFEQKEAALCLIAFFVGYNDDIITNNAAQLVSYQSAVFYGIDNYEETLAAAMPKYNDADKLIDTVLTIRDKKSKEFLLLSCYDLAKMSGNEEAYEVLYNVANEMGYNRDKLYQLIDQYSTKQQ